MVKKDKRFDKIATDPKFMTAPNQVRKVKVDKRFNKMIKDKNFVASAHKDQLGKYYLFLHFQILATYLSIFI